MGIWLPQAALLPEADESIEIIPGFVGFFLPCDRGRYTLGKEEGGPYSLVLSHCLSFYTLFAGNREPLPAHEQCSLYPFWLDSLSLSCPLCCMMPQMSETLFSWVGFCDFLTHPYISLH